jgi:hypothetical protein
VPKIVTSTPTPGSTPPIPTAPGGPASVTTPKPAAPVDGVDTAGPVIDAAALTGPTAVAPKAMLGNIPEIFPIDALSKIDGKGLSGSTYMLDGGSLRGLKLQVRRVKDGDQPGFELVFMVTADKLPGLLQRVKDKGGTAGPATFRGTELDEQGLTKYTATKGTIGTGYSHNPPDIDSSPNTWAFAVDDPKGAKLEVVHDKAALAIRGLTRIHLRGDDKKATEQLKSVINTLGLGMLFAPPTPKTKQINMLMRVLWQVDHAAARTLSEGDLDKLKVSDLEIALESAGVDKARIAGLRYEEVFPGHFTVVDPAQEKGMVEAGARYLYSTVTSPDHVYSILQAGQKSSVQRYKDGLIIDGMSTNADFVTGGATGVFTRLVTQDAIYADQSWMGRTYKLVQNSAQLARTDWYGWDGDYYGRRWNLASDTNFGVDLVKRIDGGGSYKTSNELIFTAGNRPENIDRVVATSADARDTLIKLLKEKGYTPHNGMKLEDFVVLSSKLIVHGPSPFADVKDLAAFGVEALAKAAAGTLAPLRWLLNEAPLSPERAAVEQKILLEGPPEALNVLLKAAKTTGRLALSGAELDGVLAKLAEKPETQQIPERLVTEAAEALFRSRSDKAVELLASKKPSTSSYYAPYGISDDNYVKLYEDLAAAQKPGEPRGKALSLALEIRAETLLNNNHASFRGFLQKYPQVTPADPKQFLAEKVAELKTSGATAGKVDLAMYLAQLTEKPSIGAAQKALLDADVPAALELLKGTITAHERLFIRGDVLGKSLAALPETSATRQHLLGSSAAALLKSADVSVLELLEKHHTNSYNKNFGIYGGAEWWKVIDAQLERTKGELTPPVRKTMELGSSSLVQDASFRKKLTELPALYTVTDPAAFAAQALTEVTAPGAGSLKLAWMVLGPEAETLRKPALVALLRGNYSELTSLLGYLRNEAGKLPVEPAEARALVQELAASTDAADKQALTKLLGHLGKDLLLMADAPTLAALAQASTATSQDAMQLLGLQYGAIGALLTDLAPNPLALDFAVKNAAGTKIVGNDAEFLAYLAGKDMDYTALGKDAAWAAQTIHKGCESVVYYWTDSYYSSYSNYCKIPDGAAYLLHKGKDQYDTAVLGEIEKSVKGWGWSAGALDRFLEFAAGMPEEWKAKLKAAHAAG